MGTITNFVSLLKGVCLNNVIEECVITLKDNNASIMAMDMTSSLFVQGSTGFDHEDDAWGIGNIGLLTKFFEMYKDSAIGIVRKDNLLTLKPEGGSTLKYLLSEVDLIPTYDSDWSEGIDKIKEVQEAFTDDPIPLNAAKIGEFTNLVKLTSPNSVSFDVSKRGIISIHGGNTTEHEFDVVIGKGKIEPCSVKIYSPHIAAIFNFVDFTKNPVLYMGEGLPLLIKSDNISWILNGIEGVE